jgi:uncharacterized protein (DUF952 family)
MRKFFIASSTLFFSTCFGISNATDRNAATLEMQESKVIPANKKSSTPKYLYRIVSPEEWEKSKGQQVLETSSLNENFIHLATKEQLPHIAKKFWNNKDYVILTLDTKKLIGRLVYETNPGATTLYYHLYEGNIPLDAVIDASMMHGNRGHSK